jgi:hypothetical protein
MKKIFAFTLAAAFMISSCNNNKNGKDQNPGNREKDDYGKSENTGKMEEPKSDEKMVNTDDSQSSSLISGWPQVERDAFISNCERTAIGKGSSRSVAENYCDCMLNKMETLYPDINEAAKLTEEELRSPEMEKMAKDCLKKN